MDLTKVYYYSLNRDELVYEVNIREVTPEDTTVKLRKQLKLLCNDFSPEDIIFEEAVPSAEFKIISQKLKELQSKLDTHQKSRDRNLLTRAKALYCHLYFRLERIQCTDPADLDIKSLQRNQLQNCFSILSEFLSASIQQDVLGAVGKAENPSGGDPGATVRVECSADRNLTKWNLKFDGRSNPRSFLESVTELATAYNVCDATLFKSAFCLFSDQGMLWYRGVKDQVSSWKELCDLLLEEFDPVDYDYRLLGEIRSRTQGFEEPTHIYFAIMNCMFSRLKSPLNEVEKLDILLHNIRPTFTEHLALCDIKTISELKEKCRKIESARQKSTFFEEPPKQSAFNPEFTYKGKSNKTVISVVSQSPKPQGKQKFYNKQLENENKKVFCHRCKVDTHSIKKCPATDKVIKCFKCGELGYTIRSCPKCKTDNNTKN